MSNINKMIRLQWIEIFIAVLFLVFSYFVWQHLAHGEVSEMREFASKNPSYAYVDVIDTSHSALLAIQDEEALNTLDAYQVEMVNGTYLDTIYSLGIRILKSSTLDYQNLKISVNDRVAFLKDYYIKEDDTSYYFRLDEGVLTETSKLYLIKIWVDASAGIIGNTNTISFDFVNLSNLL